MRLSTLVLPTALAVSACGHAAAVAAPPLAPAASPAPAPVAVAAAAAVAPAPDRCGLDLERLVGEELSLRPESGPEDLYQLLHQAILGPGHALADPAAARAGLEAELAGAGPPRAGEAIVEDLDERQGTVRVNLRRWKFIRASADELWPVVEASARAVGEGDRSRLAACLDGAAAVLERRGIGAAAFRALAAERAGQGFPPGAHGEAYRAAHAPSYRVVLRRFLPPWVTAPPPEAG